LTLLITRPLLLLLGIQVAQHLAFLGMCFVLVQRSLASAAGAL